MFIFLNVVFKLEVVENEHIRVDFKKKCYSEHDNYAISFKYFVRSGCNIGCLVGTSTRPATLLNKGEIGLCPKHYLPSGASQGLVQLAPLPFFAEFTCNLHRGKWLCCTLKIVLNFQVIVKLSEIHMTISRVTQA